MDLSSASLIPADGLLIMAAHASRAKIFTEWLDPSVLDEGDPSKRDVELDLFDPPALGARHHPLNQHLETRDVDLHVHH